MNHQGPPFINGWCCLNKKTTGMKQRQDNQHNIINVQLKKYICIQTVKKYLTMYLSIRTNYFVIISAIIILWIIVICAIKYIFKREISIAKNIVFILLFIILSILFMPTEGVDF